MRQQGNHKYISILNKIYVWVVNNEVGILLLSRYVAKDSPLCPKYAVNMFVENSIVVDYIDLMLNGVEGQTVTINATDGNPQDMFILRISIIEQLKIVIQEIWQVLRIKLSVLVISTSNINIEDRLVWLNVTSFNKNDTISISFVLGKGKRVK